MGNIKPFPHPVYVSRPILPELDEVSAKLHEIWDSGQLTNNGAMLGKLEGLLSRRLGSRHLSVFSNGTAALQIACRALNLTGEVITTPFTFAATPHSLVWSGLRPVFCDIKRDSYNIDPDRIEELITPETSAIVPVHVFGHPCDIDAIGRIAARHGLKVLYDAAHCFGVEVNGTPVGNFGDITMFSFHATKVYHTIEGGALSFASEELKNKAVLLRNFGIKSEDEVLETGTNAKLNELQAAVGILVLEKVEDEIARRKELTCEYRKLLDGMPGITFQEDVSGVRHNYSYFTIRVDKDEYGISRDELQLVLKQYNVYARKYFYPLCSSFACYSELPSAEACRLPEAVKAAEQILALPLYSSLSDSDVEKICRIIRKVS